MNASARIASFPALVIALVLASACGEATPPKSPEPAANAPAAAAPTTPSADEAAPSGSAAAPPSRKRAFEIKSLCDAPVPLFYGESPEKGDGKKLTIEPKGTSTVERIAEEPKSHVWLLDADGKPLAHVRVSRGMKTVEIGASCRTLT